MSKPFDYWLKKNKYYHYRLKKFFNFVVPDNSKILVINCKNGYLLESLNPAIGVGIDDDEQALQIARKRYPQYRFYSGNRDSKHPEPTCKLNSENFSKCLKSKILTGLNKIPQGETFDYIILPSVTMEAEDIQELFNNLQRFSHPSTRIVIDTYSYFWEPVLKITQILGMRRPTNLKNWISRNDMNNFLYLSGFEPVTHGYRMLIPLHIPLISTFFNSFLAHIPIIQRLCLHEWIVARPVFAPNGASSGRPVFPSRQEERDKNYSVSVIVPCKNEKGNVEKAVTLCPTMGKNTEIIFVEGGSKDGTFEEIKRVAQKYPEKNISFYKQESAGKGDAVRKGFSKATGDILMILDADLTTPPQELPKFFDALVTGKGEFINGSRLVYGMESNAMRPIAILANFCFGLLLRWIIGQKIKDSLCGTKVLFKSNYEKIAKNRHIFGDHDPFGDFDLIFGAAKLNLKIVDMPVHYKDRTYGQTQINRFKHFWFLLFMSIIAWRKFKLR